MLTRLEEVYLSDEDEISDVQGSCAFSPFPRNGLVELDAASIAAVFNSQKNAMPRSSSSGLLSLRMFLISPTLANQTDKILQAPPQMIQCRIQSAALF